MKIPEPIASLATVTDGKGPAASQPQSHCRSKSRLPDPTADRFPRRLGV